MKYRINNMQSIIWGNLNDEEYVILYYDNERGAVLRFVSSDHDRPPNIEVNEYVDGDDFKFSDLYNDIHDGCGYNHYIIGKGVMPSNFGYVDLAIMLERASNQNMVFIL